MPSYGLISNYGPVENLDSPAIGIVTEGWGQAQQYADAAFNDARVHIGRLTDIAQAIGELPEINLQIDPVTQEIAGFVMPALPAAPDGLTPSFPLAPIEPTLGGVSSLDFGELPTFDAVMPAIELDIAAPGVPVLSLPAAPNVRDIAVPTAPAEPALVEVLSLVAPDAPEFTAIAPVLNLDIASPSPLDVNVPVVPALVDVTIPSAPTLDLPAVPSLTSIVIPTAPELALPVFDGVLGTAPTTPGVSFAFGEERYTSSLLDDLRSHLSSWVNGAATGLAPAVEDALWNRARDREQAAGVQLSDEAIRSFAVRGFTRPPGALAIALQKAAQSVMDNSVTASREITIKQAELEQANRKFAFETAWQIESGLVQYTGQIATRALDAAKFTASLGLDIFRAEVQRYDADIRAFSGRAEVFKALLQAELSRLDVFRSQIEAQKLVGEVNQQLVALYSARVGAAGQIIDLFRAAVAGAQATAEVQKTRIMAFGEEVRAYGEQVRAKGSEYENYSSRIRAEVAKAETFKVEADAFNSRIQGFTSLLNARVQEKQSEVDVKQRLPIEMYKARTEGFRNVISGLQTAAESDKTRVQLYGEEVRAVDALLRTNAQAVDIYRARNDAQQTKADVYRIQSEAYGSTVTAFKTRVDALVAKINSEIRVNQELPLEVYKSRAQGFDSLVRAESERLRAVGGTYETQGRIFDAQVRGESARVGSDVERFKADSDYSIKSAEIRLKEAEANVEKARQQLQLLVESVKSGAQVAAQLAASSLSGINFSSGASISYNNSASNSSSNSSSFNFGVSNSFSESESKSTVTSISQ